MPKLDPVVVALSAAPTVLALALLLSPSVHQRSVSSEFSSKAGEGIATGGAPKPAERP